MLWPVQSLDVTWAWDLGWQEGRRSPRRWVLLSDCKISLLRVFGGAVSSFSLDKRCI